MSAGQQMMLAGGAGKLVAITNQSVTNVTSLTPATARYLLLNSGVIQTQTLSTSNNIGFWVIPQTNMSDYEVRATQTATNSNGSLSPSLTTGVPSSWANLVTTQSWALDIAAGDGTATRSLTIEIRAVAGGSVLTSATILLTATSV